MIQSDHYAVGQRSGRRPIRYLLLTAVYPLAVQMSVDAVDALARLNPSPWIARQAGRFEALEVGPAALRAGAVPAGQRGRLVQEEQLRIAGRLHHRPPAASEVEQTGDPAAPLPA